MGKKLTKLDGKKYFLLLKTNGFKEKQTTNIQRKVFHGKDKFQRSENIGFYGKPEVRKSMEKNLTKINWQNNLFSHGKQRIL